MNIRTHLVAALLALAVSVFAPGAHAQTTDAPPALTLDAPTEGETTPEYAAKVKLANQRLTGPRLEIVGGAALIGGGAFTMAMGTLISLIQAEDEESSLLGTGVILGGLAGVAIGAGLLGHGIRRVRVIRTARREIAFQGAQFAVRDGGLQAGATFSF